MAGDNLFSFSFFISFFFLTLTERTSGLCCLFVMFDANGRLSDHLLERASEGPRSKRQMFCPAPVMDCSCVNFTPSRKSVLRTNRQADRLRNHAGSPASLGQWSTMTKRALFTCYLPAIYLLSLTHKNGASVWLAVCRGATGEWADSALLGMRQVG